MRTSHIPLNNNLFRIKRTATSNCPHCRAGTRETLLHFVLFCPHYEEARQHIRDIINRQKNVLAYLMGKREGIPSLLCYIGTTGRMIQSLGNVTPPDDFTLRSIDPKPTTLTTNLPPHTPQ